MQLVLERRWKKESYTIGRLMIDGVQFCNILEDRDRGLNQTDSVAQILARKVPGETAIPTGEYEIAMGIVSPKYAFVTWYRNLCGGKMPRLLNVPGFDGILIHPGNTALDCTGCLLPGYNTKKGQVTSSREVFQQLYKKMKDAHDRGEKIKIQII